MPVDFLSPEFRALSKKEKKEIILEEFIKCRDDFTYYVTNYAYIRHPNAGIIQMRCFDFQLDVAVPISLALKTGRSQETINQLRRYSYKFDYQKWLKEVIEQNLELSKIIPSEVHQFWRHVVKHPDFPTRIDTIILKSRQTGISTIMQQLNIWHINFYPSVYHLVVSQADREAKKYLNDAKTSWQLIPAPLKARKLSSNVHELWVSVVGKAEYKSGIQALPPTTDAGRSYAPNLIILDEMAMYRNADEVYTAISMSVAGGGITVIISTPKGVGNLFHRLWTAAKESLLVHVKKPEDQEAKSAFRPVVIHWSQMPHEEFKRRGFSDALSWYKHMRAKVAQRGGERAVAQELDLSFLTSGNTINPKLIQKLIDNSIEMSKDLEPRTLSNGLVIVQPPIKDVKYVLGIDTSEGIGEDYQFFHIHRADNGQIVGYFASNTTSIGQFASIVRETGKLYNNAYLMIERNNHGHVLLSKFIEDGLYPEHLVFNRYDVTKFKFMSGYKGWQSSQTSRNYLITSLFSWLDEMADSIHLPLLTAEEFKTFVNNNGKWEAQRGFHDDGIISLALGVMGVKLLGQYEQFIREHNLGPIEDNIDPDIVATSSIQPIISSDEEQAVEPIQEEPSTLLEELRQTLVPDEVKKFKSKEEETRLREIDRARQRMISRVEELPDDDDELYVF